MCTDGFASSDNFLSLCHRASCCTTGQVLNSLPLYVTAAHCMLLKLHKHAKFLTAQHTSTQPFPLKIIPSLRSKIVLLF